jgi:hypothetical protein
MKKIFIAAAGIAMLSAFSTVGAYAQSTGPAGQNTAMQGDTNTGAMNSQAKMSKKKMMMMKKKKMMMKKDGMSGGMGMKKM